jgi:hypothetical protein
MKRRFFHSSVSLIIVLLLIAPCWGLDQIVEKKTFSLKEFTLVSGKKISPVQIGVLDITQANEAITKFLGE